MHIPSNREKIQIISELFREGMDKHELTGGKYYDDTAVALAGHAIQTFMPEIASWQQNRVVVEANSGLLIDGANVTTLEGMAVEARLERVSIQQLIGNVAIGDIGLSIDHYDLFAVLRPRYVDPDPQDIVFGEEVMVPFSEVRLFEAA